MSVYIRPSLYVEALTMAAADIQAASLGFSLVEVKKCEPRGALTLQDGLVAVVGTPNSPQVALAADKPSSEALARMLFGKGPRDLLVRDDLHDGLGELANIVAGSVKKHLAPQGLQMDLGTPNILDATGFHTLKQLVVVDVEIDHVSACLFVLY